MFKYPHGVSELRLTTSSVEETQAIAAAFADVVVAGDLVLLAGDLGAGKTAFTKGLATALGVTEPVTSPTFTLAQVYKGRLTLNHLDVYRLEQMTEVIDLAIPELLDGDSVTLVEWGDVVVPALPANFMEIEFTFGEGFDDRVLTFRATGATWTARTRALVDVFQSWQAAPC